MKIITSSRAAMHLTLNTVIPCALVEFTACLSRQLMIDQIQVSSKR